MITNSTKKIIIKHLKLALPPKRDKHKQLSTVCAFLYVCMPADVRTWWIACPLFWFPSPHHLMQISAHSKLKLLLVLPILPHLKIAQIIAQISSFFPELQVLHSPPSVFNVISLSLSLLISLPSRFFSSFCFTVFMPCHFELP